MNNISFKHSANIFINTGIVSLYHYLQKWQEEGAFDYQYSFSLEKKQLNIESDNLFQVLEDVYYFMGKEVYDTITQKQQEGVKKGTDCNLYYDEKKEQFVPFPKIKNYGLPELFTNGKPKNTKKEKNQSKIAALKKSDPDLAERFEQEFKKRKIKLGSIIYFNEPYTTIPRLQKIESAFFEESTKKTCALTGEGYKKLVDINNNSPFIKKQGTTNFRSFFKSNSYEISWKSMYTTRFSPKLCFYSYVNGLEGLICYLFESDNLKNLNTLYLQNRSFYKNSTQLLNCSYMSNFVTYNFKKEKKDDENFINSNDYTEQNDMLFALIYSFYKQFLKTKTGDVEKYEFLDLEFEEIPISLISFKSEKFSTTLRPNSFIVFNQFWFVIKVINQLEREQVNFGKILSSLKFLKPSEKSSKNSYRIERQLRDKVLNKFLNAKSILFDISNLFFQTYILLVSKENIKYKNFPQLKHFTELYESKINKNMNKDIQQKAINLGTSIGMSILKFESPKNKNEEKTNARNGRKYIIDLHKSRTLEQFNESIIRLQNKYNLIVSKDLLPILSQENFELIKQFAIIGALNQINTVLNFSKPKNNENAQK